jgi:hypothetical protein
MGDKGEKKLNAAQQRFVVQSLARFMSPSEVATAVKEHFEIELTRQAVERYDPTKAAGDGLKQELRDLFTKAREEYIAGTNNAPLAHKAYRLEVLLRLAEKAEAMKNLNLAGQLVKQAKEEVEGVAADTPNSNGKSNSPAQANLTVTIKNESGASLQAGSGAPKPGD